MNAPDPQSDDYRRPLAREDEDRWIALSERLPRHDEFPIQLLDRTGHVAPCSEADGGDCAAFWIGRYVMRRDVFTHWKPLRLSPPPEPQKSKEEAAFEKVWVDVLKAVTPISEKPSCRASWLAAIAWIDRM